MSIRDDKENTGSAAMRESRPAPLSRRAFIKKGAGASMPVILTLQSGAALARSSNLVSASSPQATDNLGRTLCLDTNTVYQVGEYGDIYDFGDPSSAVVNIIPADHTYQVEKNMGSAQISGGGMCPGGTFWYNDQDGMGWQSIDLPYKGVVVSSGAFVSMTDDIWTNLL